MSRTVLAARIVMVVSAVLGLVLLGPGMVVRASDVRTVDMLDRCDPQSFNAMFGPGTCVFDHPGVSLGTFVSVLERSQTMGAWHFAPGVVRLQEGQAFQARNMGGEMHTFTEVEAFGGGFIPELNALSGNPEPAPECLNFGSIEFIAPGDTSEAEVESKGTHHYMCCIHPWMRADVTVR
jgi:plastocyanin